MTRRRPRRVMIAALVMASAVATCTAFAASLAVTSKKLTTWHSATSITCTPGSVTASASADTYLDQDNASTNFGSATSLKVRAQLTVLGIGGNARTLVKFTLPTIPDLCTMTLAKLRLNATAATSGRTLEAVRVTGAWTESTTWNSGTPATTGTAVAISSGSGTGYREWTVTSQVTAMYSGTNNGFLVRDDAESPLVGLFEQTFSSREAAANQPQLVITYG